MTSLDSGFEFLLNESDTGFGLCGVPSERYIFYSGDVILDCNVKIRYLVPCRSVKTSQI
jgi:hypothetical protein